MTDEEFGSIELLRLKYRKGDQIIQTFCKIGSSQKLSPSSLICTNLKTLREALLNHAEYIKMQLTTKIWIKKTFKIEIQKAGPNNSDILQNWFPPEIRTPVFDL